MIITFPRFVSCFCFGHQEQKKQHDGEDETVDGEERREPQSLADRAVGFSGSRVYGWIYHKNSGRGSMEGERTGGKKCGKVVTVSRRDRGSRGKV